MLSPSATRELCTPGGGTGERRVTRQSPHAFKLVSQAGKAHRAAAAAGAASGGPAEQGAAAEVQTPLLMATAAALQQQQQQQQQQQRGGRIPAMPSLVGVPVAVAAPVAAVGREAEGGLFVSPLAGPTTAPNSVEPTPTSRAGGAEAVGPATELKKPYSRKDKSLGLLCENFLYLYGDGNEGVISIDTTAQRLGVERRRIYDIVNVLESLRIVQRQAKNRYEWNGLAKMRSHLADLRRQGKEEFGAALAKHGLGLSSPAADQENREVVSATPVPPELENGQAQGGERQALGGSEDVAADSDAEGAPEGASGSRSGRRKSAGSDARREKSLGLLSTKFIMLFLACGDDPVSLDTSASVLLGGTPSANDLKTKVRRLYDIANILVSLRLIQKVTSDDCRKPSFQWLRTEETIEPANAKDDLCKFLGVRCPDAEVAMNTPAPRRGTTKVGSARADGGATGSAGRRRPRAGASDAQGGKRKAVGTPAAGGPKRQRKRATLSTLAGPNGAAQVAAETSKPTKKAKQDASATDAFAAAAAAPASAAFHLPGMVPGSMPMLPGMPVPMPMPQGPSAKGGVAGQADFNLYMANAYMYQWMAMQQVQQQQAGTAVPAAAAAAMAAAAVGAQRPSPEVAAAADAALADAAKTLAKVADVAR